MQEQLSSLGSLRYMTTTDGGNADTAGANIRPSIHGYKKGEHNAPPLFTK